MAADEKVAFIHTMNNRMGEVKLNLVLDYKLLRFLLINSNDWRLMGRSYLKEIIEMKSICTCHHAFVYVIAWFAVCLGLIALVMQK